MPKICIIQILQQKENPIPAPHCLIHNPHNAYVHHNSLIQVLILSRTALHVTDQVLRRDLASHVVSTPTNLFSLEQLHDPVRSHPIGLPKKNSSASPGQNVSFNVNNSAFIYLFVGWNALAKARRGKEKNRSKNRTLTGKHLGS